MEDIDIASVLRKINLDKKYRVLDIKFYSAPPGGLLNGQFKTTRYRFLKPFLEGGYYKNIPSNEIVKLIQPTRWSNPTLNVLDLFPSKQAFYDFIEENPSVTPTKLPPFESTDVIIMTARKS
jgi:hypothetical protein